MDTRSHETADASTGDPVGGRGGARDVRRRVNRTLVTGRGQYTDDIDADGAAHLVFVRSTIAHGVLREVETTVASTMPGVVAILTAAGATTADDPGSLQDWGIPDVRAVPDLPGTFDRPPLARGRVRFVGDIVAAVIGETREQAIDAAETVEVGSVPLPSVIDAESAATDTAPVVWDEHGSNVCFETSCATDEAPLEGADVVVSARIVSQRLAAVPIETDAALAVPGPDDSLTLYIPSQNPHAVRDSIAAVLGLDAERLQVVAPQVGGAFGAKADLHVEFVVVAAAARLLGRPVRWTQTRSENFVAMSHGRAMVMDASLALRRDGTMLGISADVIADSGAYPTMGAVLPIETQLMSQGVYDVGRLRFRARSVTTNTTPTGAYRGVARAEATQMVERLVDRAADELGIDPVDLRRRNLLRAERFPVTTSTGAEYDSGDYGRALDVATAAIDYRALRAEQARRRSAAADGGAGLLGIGIALYVYSAAGSGAHQEHGEVSIEPDGRVAVKAGTANQGQGHETTFSALVADVLGVDDDQVLVVEGDTGLVPNGVGTFGSRSVQTAGSAVHEAAHAVRDKARALAAHLLEAADDDIVTGPDGLGVVGDPASKMSWADIARAASDPDLLPDGMAPGLSHEHFFDGGDATYPFGAHAAVVEVDPETGAVHLLRHVAVDDCGRIIDPVAVTGQQHGGAAQGVSQALHEWFQYDESGHPLTGTLLDYVVPSAADLPSWETHNTETPTQRNPLGVKGIGESGAIGATPAVHNAVIDALSHLGVRDLDMPCTPQRIWEAIAHQGGDIDPAGGDRPTNDEGA